MKYLNNFNHCFIFFKNEPEYVEYDDYYDFAAPEESKPSESVVQVRVEIFWFLILRLHPSETYCQ